MITQIALFFAIGMLGQFDPAQSLTAIVAVVFTVSLFSASQDIVIDAYRRELLADDELGTGTSFFVNAYRLASLVPGSLALILSDHLPWPVVYWITAGFMLVGVVTTLVIREVSDDKMAPHTLRVAVIEPFREFFSRDGVGAALAILAFMFLYKLGDSMATALATPFYLDMGFSRTEIGSIAKVAALWSVIAGSIIGGIAMLKLSINRALWIFGFCSIDHDSRFCMAQRGRPQPGGSVHGRQRRIPGCWSRYRGADSLYCARDQPRLYRHAVRAVHQLYCRAPNFCQCQHRFPDRSHGLYAVFPAVYRSRRAGDADAHQGSALDG